MLKAIDRYVLKEISSPFAIGLLVYTFTLLIHNIILLSNTFIARGASSGTIFKILIFLLPDLLAFTIPMSTLMGVLAGLSRMSTDSEILALRTMGVNNLKIFKPVLLFSILTWLFSSWLIMYVAPESNFQLSKLMGQVVLSRTVSNIKPKTFYRRFPYYVLYFNEMDHRSGEWKDIFLYSMKRPDEDNVILARRGKFIQKQEKKKSYIILRDAVVYGYKKKEPQSSYAQSFKFLREYIPDLFNIKQSRRSTQQTFPALLEILKHEPNNVALSLEFHNKLALPFTCLAFGFLALSLGISTKKGGKISGFIISLGIIFLYYTLITTARNLVLKRIVSPFLGMWFPNIMLILVSLVLYYFSAREKSIDWDKVVTFFRSQWRFGKSKTILVLKFKRLRFRLIKILDLYVLKRLVLIFLLLYFSLIMIFGIITVVEMIDEAIKNEVGFSYILRYMFYTIPEFSSLFLPVSILTAVLLTFSTMSKNNEIVAVQVSGIGLHRLTLPAIFFGIVISFTALFIQEYITPNANQRAQDMRNIIYKISKPASLEYSKGWVAATPHKFYIYNQFDQRTNSFVKFNLLRMNENSQLTERVFAETAKWVSGQELRLNSGFVRRFEGGLPSHYEEFGTRRIEIQEEKEIFTKRVLYDQFMNIKQMKEYISYLKRNQSNSRKYEAKLYYKYAFPFSSLIMVLIAIPFSFIMGNRGTLYGIGIAVGISMVFWGAKGIFGALGSTTVLSPFLSAFAPLFLFAALSIFLFMNIKT